MNLNESCFPSVGRSTVSSESIWILCREGKSNGGCQNNLFFFCTALRKLFKNRISYCLSEQSFFSVCLWVSSPGIRRAKDWLDTPAGGNAIAQKSFVVLGDGRGGQGQRSCSTGLTRFPWRHFFPLSSHLKKEQFRAYLTTYIVKLLV